MKKLLILTMFLFYNMAMASTPHLTLYFIPAPHKLDWSSPANLAWSALKSKLSFESRFMGHVFVEFQCSHERELTGMVGKNFDYLNQLLINNRGLGILYHSFDGRLEEAAAVDAEIKDLSLSGTRLNFARFELNESQCQRVSTYLKEYRTNNVGRYYGLANRPLYGEGAGCSAFGASFVEVLDLMEPDIREAWSHTVNIPLKHAGPPVQDLQVSLFQVMFNAGSWASETEPHKKLTFWSPDMMYEWVNQKVAKNDSSKYRIESIRKSRGVVFDRTQLPVPQSPIWRQHLDANNLTKK